LPDSLALCKKNDEKGEQSDFISVREESSSITAGRASGFA